MALKQLVYVPEDKIETWSEIVAAAKKEKRGIAFYICQKWEENKIKKERF